MARARGASTRMDRWVRQLGDRIGRELGQIIAEGLRSTLSKSVDTAVLTRRLSKDGNRPARLSAGKGVCTAPGCKNPVLAKGLCRPHYYRARYRAMKAGTLQPRRRRG